MLSVKGRTSDKGNTLTNCTFSDRCARSWNNRSARERETALVRKRERWLLSAQHL